MDRIQPRTNSNNKKIKKSVSERERERGREGKGALKEMKRRGGWERRNMNIKKSFLKVIIRN
jgi:hypothetical protein